MGSKIILILLVTIVSVIVPNVLAMKPIPWTSKVSSPCVDTAWLNVASWLSGNFTFTWEASYQVQIETNEHPSYIAIMQVNKELDKYFFVVYTSGDGGSVHMISKLGIQQQVEDGAAYYYEFIGDEFYKGDFQSSEGKQLFHAKPDFVSKLQNDSKLRNAVAEKLEGGKQNFTEVNKHIAQIHTQRVDAYPELYAPGAPFLSINYSLEEMLLQGKSVAGFDVIYDYPV